MSCSVGVVIPLYNKAPYIRRAVDSVLRQTHGDFRLTIVDDGSTDGSVHEVDKISDSRVTLIRAPHRGPGAARNVGMRVTDADWIGLLDADDEWRPTFLEKTMHAARRVPGVVAVFTGIHVQNASGPRGAAVAGLMEDYHGARMRSQAAMTSSSVLLQRKSFLSLGGFREGYRYAEDTEAWFRLTCGGPVYYIPEALSDIGVSDAGATTRSADSLERAVGLKQLLDSYEAYRRTGQIPAVSARSCRRFMQHQRGRLALHLFSAGLAGAGARVLLTGVPLGLHTWREYVRCASLAVSRNRWRSARPLQ